MTSNNLFYVFMIGFVIVLMGTFVFSGSNGISNEGRGEVASGEVQVVKLSVSGGTYVLTPSTLKKGVPVRLEADYLPGCARSIVINAFNVRKSFTSSSNSVTFTPDKAGTFNIACSMNMYRGTFTVTESDGRKSDYAEPALAGGSSCGGGGCGGCGG